MIRYALLCDDGHPFDSWFFDSAAFDQQSERGLVECPFCGSHHVVKALMAPAVVASRGVRKATDTRDPPNAKPAEAALVDEQRRDLVRAFRDKIMAGTRDVGRAFASEARRIHGTAADAERIRGQATLEEARDLLEDGIMVLPLPAVPEDFN